MDFEWCFGTFVPCFGGQTTKGGQEPAKHGIDHTPDPVAMQWPCLPEHKLRTLRTRSVRRASGLVQTALSEKCGPPGVVLGAKTRFAPELVPVESSALRQVTGFRTGRGARALSRHIGSLPRCRRGFVDDDGTPRRQIGTNVLPCASRREQVTMLPQRFLAGGERGVLELGK